MVGRRRGLGAGVVVAAAIGVAASATIAACSDDDGGADRADVVAAFCDEAPDPSETVPASYVGSDEHVDDLRRLRDLAPDELRADLELIVVHFDTAVDPSDSDSQLIFNFPDEVNDATGRVTAFIDERCPS